jgi:UDP-N-acetylmuramate--alanine ligase
MDRIDTIELALQEPCHVHFVGIGGISMSGLAEILLKQGFTVSGSDAKESKVTAHLTKLGATIVYGHRTENISEDIRCLVYTAAVKEDNPELLAAKEFGILCVTRAVLLGEIMRKYPTAISVAGTHGKTTTTSMLSQILLESELDPTILVGGMLKAIDGNVRVGQSGYFVTEACEYTNSYHAFHSTISIILNVREDHMDFFKDINEIRESFRTFADLMDENGTLVLNSEIDDFSYFTDGLKCKAITFGLNPETSDYYATDITYNAFACGSFTVMKRAENHAEMNTTDGAVEVAKVELKVPGEHNVLNALAAFVTAQLLQIPAEQIASGLNAYTGTDRRFQYKGVMNGVTIIDDYAHHPDEITATLTAARNYPHKKLWCVFQPHTFTRTKAFMQEFATSLLLADEVILAEIYPARETDNLGISSQTLQAEIEKLGKTVHYFPTFEDIQNFIQKNCINGDLLITMGAGDVVNIGENLLK